MIAHQDYPMISLRKSYSRAGQVSRKQHAYRPERAHRNARFAVPFRPAHTASQHVASRLP
jgi:hypothetical protein